MQLLFVSMPAALQYVKAGKLRALAVTSDKRSVAAPDMPTIAESGVPDCVVNSWYGALVPAKTPPAIVAKLQAAFVKVLQIDSGQGTPARCRVPKPRHRRPPNSTSSSRTSCKQWDYVIREAKIKPE